MEKTALIELSDTKMRDTGGGGFAYDVGRFLRFVALGAGYYALVDWAVNDAVNEIVNNPPE